MMSSSNIRVVGLHALRLSKLTEHSYASERERNSVLSTIVWMVMSLKTSRQNKAFVDDGA